jgi:hypothetical protein
MTEEKRQLAMDFKDTFGSPFGERVLAELDKRTTMNRPSVSSAGVIDPNRIIYDEGQRAMMVFIHAQVNKDVEVKKKARAKNDRK